MVAKCVEQGSCALLNLRNSRRVVRSGGNPDRHYRPERPQDPDIVWVRDAVNLQMEYVSPRLRARLCISLGQASEGDDFDI